MAERTPVRDPGEPWSRVFRWIEREVGGRVVSFERQARWRPAAFLEVEREGEVLPLYFRGARPEIPDSDAVLRHEMNVLRQLSADGIPVSHVYGMCEDPPGIVMEWSDGRANLATAGDEDERRGVLDHYMDILAQMHALPVEPFEAIGLTRPATPEQSALCDLPKWESRYRKSKQRPEPLIEFVLGWLKRNIPERRDRLAFLAADSGQFLFRDGRVTALLDLELACLGDPAADLAGMRGRDLSEPLGDLPRAFRRYFESTGDAIPARVIDYHTVRFSLCTPMAVAPIVARPPSSVDIVQYLGWYWVWSRACLEVIAHGMGLRLPPLDSIPQAMTAYAPVHDALVGRLEAAAKSGSEAGDVDAYERDVSARTAQLLRRVDQFGPGFQAAELEGIAALVGESFDDIAQADVGLEAFVDSASPDADADLIRFFYQRTLRHEHLLGPTLRELEGVSIQLLD